MSDNPSFTLNLTSEPKKQSYSKNESSFDHKFSSKKNPLISFVSKPKFKNNVTDESGKKKPAYVVVRKKAALPVKKKLSEVISTNLTTEHKGEAPIKPSSVPPPKFSTLSKPKSPAVKPSANGETKITDKTVSFGKSLRTTKSKQTRDGKEKQARKKPGSWTVAEKPSIKTTGIISSLFIKNPEIPVVQKENVETTSEAVFSSRKFSDLKLHPHLIATLEKDLGLHQMTEAQARTIPFLLSKKDSLVKSQTGSGKTLAYAIPIVEKLQSINPKIDRSSGVFALVIVPTRELVLQTYSWFTKILKAFTWVVPGYLMGGEKKKSEKARIRKGMNILISTPGRLLDHLSSTKNLNLGRLHWLVLDEADRLLDMGYEKDVAKVMNIVEEHFTKEGGFGRRQTVMLSATLSSGVEKLAGLALTDPEHINVSEDSNVDKLVIPTSLQQWYLMVPPKLRLVTLSAFILWKCLTTKEKKILVFLTTQDSVDYHLELFSRVLTSPDAEKKVNFYKLHGSMLQKDRTAIFKEFRDAESGVLLCTDVAARGLDLPSVDWIVQYNPPVSLEDYVHRVGRTARVGNCGQALIFLAPHEAGFVNRLAKRGISMEETNADPILVSLVKTWAKGKHSMAQAATALQLSLEETVIESFNLYEMATKGYVSFVRSYATFPKDVRDVFDFQQLHLGHYAKSFALRDPPAHINSAGRKVKRNDRVQPFKTARERAAERKPQPGSTDERPAVRLNYSEKRAMLSEYQSGLDGYQQHQPPSKRAKSAHQKHR